MIFCIRTPMFSPESRSLKAGDQLACPVHKCPRSVLWVNYAASKMVFVYRSTDLCSLFHCFQEVRSGALHVFSSITCLRSNRGTIFSSKDYPYSPLHRLKSCFSRPVMNAQHEFTRTGFIFVCCIVLEDFGKDRLEAALR